MAFRTSAPYENLRSIEVCKAIYPFKVVINKTMLPHEDVVSFCPLLPAHEASLLNEPLWSIQRILTFVSVCVSKCIIMDPKSIGSMS
jgi:hypothetical protein